MALSTPESFRNSLDRWLSEGRRGDPDGLGAAFERCGEYLRLMAARQLPADIRARLAPSDLVQETLRKAYRNIDRFRGTTEAKLLAWLRRILLNHLRDVVEKERARGVPRSLDGGSSSARLLRNLACDEALPAARLAAKEEFAALDRALERLPELQCRAILLRFRERRSFKQIGKELRRSADAARQLLRRGLARLERELEPKRDSR